MGRLTKASLLVSAVLFTLIVLLTSASSSSSSAVAVAAAAAPSSPASAPSDHGSSKKLPKLATHDGLRKLTESNFTLTQQGSWLIEFFSPSCAHCKQFGPTWSELNVNKDNLRSWYPQAPFTLAQVDCMAQKDVCIKEGVQFFPRLTLYVDGVQAVSEYSGERTYEEVSAYIDKHASAYRKLKGVLDRIAPPETSQPSIPPTPASTAETKEAVVSSAGNASPVVGEQNPSPSASAATTPPQEVGAEGPNSKGQLISFGGAEIGSKEALAQWLQKGSGKGPTFVKFFAPWCPHCKAMAGAFKELGASLKDRINVVEVDCEANRAVCDIYQIRGYPTLRLYNDGQMTEYKGGRNHDAMLKWALKAGSNNGVREIDAEELFHVAKKDEVFFLYLHSPATPEEEEAMVEEAGKSLMGTNLQMYTSLDPKLLDIYSNSLTRITDPDQPGLVSTSGLLVFKDHQLDRVVKSLWPSTFATTLSRQEKVKNIQTWISRNRYPTLTEVNGASFQDVINNETGNLVVLAALSDLHHGGVSTTDSGIGARLRDEELRKIREIAAFSKTFHDAEIAEGLVWAWIDADRWASALKKLYNQKPKDFPALILIDGLKLEYYPLPTRPSSFSKPTGSWLDKEEVLEAIQMAIEGKVKPKSSRSYLDRGLRGAGGAVDNFIVLTSTHPYYSLGFIAFLLVSLFIYLRKVSKSPSSSINSSKDPTLPMSYQRSGPVKAD
ncbi:thioredoxin-like protein [Violaceomyces palustris]|uniref:Thioredoxin-like protein n=1 Tax=Violaceomyces palustris TaxID=1673888 RepID=A0ACD0NUV5_9BASI|nr:thioredoxin-like protein [Violaceomyces palustris]